MQRSKTDNYHLTKTMNVTKPYSAFVGPGYSFSVLTEVTLNLCKKGTVLTISHTSLWLQMERCTGHSYLKIQLLPSRIFFSLEFIFLVAITSKKTYKKGRGGGSPFSFL